MRNIVIIIYDGCWAMSVFSVSDFFRIVAILEAMLAQESSFIITMASANGLAIKSSSNFTIQPDCALTDITSADLIVIPPMEGPQLNNTSDTQPDISNWLISHIKNKTPILSLTTGADILAATQLLDSKLLCSHWAFINLLKRKYPRSKFTAHESFLFDEHIYSTGSLDGTLDALLSYLAQEKGDKFAQVCASHLLVTQPSKMTPLLFKHRNHTDNAILAVQDWLESNYQTDLNIEVLANKFGFSGRNLKRRFVLATKLPPNKYLQKVRVDKAKKLLISTTLNIKEIAYQVGYENDSFFNRVFKESTGMTLGQWRKSTQDI